MEKLYDGDKWKNKRDRKEIQSDKISINSLLKLYIERAYNMKKLYDEESSYYFGFENKIKQIVEECLKEYLVGGMLIEEKEWQDDLEYEYERNGTYPEDFRFHNFYKIDLVGQYANFPQLDKNKSNYVSPSIFISLDEDNFKVKAISSIPISYKTNDKKDNTVISVIPEETINKTLRTIEVNSSEILNLYNLKKKIKNKREDKKWFNRKEELIELIKDFHFKLDNGIILKLNLKNIEENFERGNFKVKDIIIDVYAQNKFLVVNKIDHLENISLYEKAASNLIDKLFGKKNEVYYQGLLDYETSTEDVLPLFEAPKNMEDIKKIRKVQKDFLNQQCKTEIKHIEEESKDKTFEEKIELLKNYASKMTKLQLIGKKIKKEDKIEIDEEDLFEKDKNGILKIKDILKDFLSVLDLSKINFNNVDVSGVDFSNCDDVDLSNSVDTFTDKDNKEKEDNKEDSSKDDKNDKGNSSSNDDSKEIDKKEEKEKTENSNKDNNTETKIESNSREQVLKELLLLMQQGEISNSDLDIIRSVGKLYQ